MLCDRCKDKDHSDKGHHIIHITIVQVNISEMQIYKTKLDFLKFLAVSQDGSLWIGDGFGRDYSEIIFPTWTALQNVKLVGDRVKIISSFNLWVWDVAVTPNNDILLATREPRLKQIKAGSKKVTDSIYQYCTERCTKWLLNKTVHVTKDGQVVVGGDRGIVVIDTNGRHLTRYEYIQQIFIHKNSSITSTINGNIFMAGERKVVVCQEREIVNIYGGHPTANHEDTEFSASSVATTPMGNVIVADSFNNTLHILNNTGHLLTTYNTKNIGIPFPKLLGITSKGSFTVLFITTTNPKSTSLYKMVITGC